MLLLFVVLLRLDSCLGYSHQDLVDLQSNLFRNYTRAFRPTRNQSEPTTISITFALSSIQSYEIRTGDVNVFGYAYFDWFDEFLTWNSTSFNGLDTFIPPENTAWVPSIVILDSNKPNALKNSNIGSHFVSSNGSSKFMTYGIIQTKCDTDITKYPFDEHECNFILAPSAVVSSEILLNCTNELIMDAPLLQNEEWMVLNPSISNYIIENMSVVHVKIRIRRRPFFLLLHVFVPSILIGWLNGLTCLIPPDSGERVSFAASLFLSVSFVTTAVTEDLPKNSLNVSIFSIFLTLINGLSVLGICWSVFMIRLANFQSNTSIPQFMRSVYVYCMNRKSRRNVTDHSKNNGFEPSVLASFEAKTETCTSDHITESDVKNNDAPEMNIRSSEIGAMSDAQEDVTWRNIAGLLDIVYFVFVIIYITIATSIFFYYGMTV